MMRKRVSLLAIGALILAAACVRSPAGTGGEAPALTGTYIGDGWARERPELLVPVGLDLEIGHQVLVDSKTGTDPEGNTWRLVRKDQWSGWVPESHLVLPGQEMAEAVHERSHEVLSSITGDLESMAAATGQYQGLLALIAGHRADDLFRAWRERLMDLLPVVETSPACHEVATYVIADGEVAMADPGLIPDPEVRRWAELVLAAGYTVKMSEGMPYLALNPAVLGTFAACLSGPLADFLTMLAGRTARPPAADAALMIPWDEVRERAVAAERWLLENSELPEAAEVEAWMGSYMRIYLRGLDNSPVFPFGSDHLDPQLKASYERFLEENRDSGFFAQVEEFYRLLEEHSFRLTPQVRAFLQRR